MVRGDLEVGILKADWKRSRLTPYTCINHVLHHQILSISIQFTLMDGATCRVLWLRHTDTTVDGQWCYMGVQRWRGKCINRSGLVAGAACHPPQRLKMTEEETDRWIETLQSFSVSVYEHVMMDVEIKVLHFQYSVAGCVGRHHLVAASEETTKP